MLSSEAQDSVMCGICGELNFRSPASAETVEKMLGPLEDRGPDSIGVFVQEAAGIGHRRLSILDLAPTSQQPMVDPELGLAIVFNGCIYNFKELRSELAAKGYRFFSEGDTEVILKAYAAWGPRCVERFMGMFAFAIHERDTGRMILARDRLGIKPLYYSHRQTQIRFASTLPALLAAGDIDTSIDNKALHHYMSWHAVVPAPETILKGVRKLPPATIMTIDADGKCREECYWSISVGVSPAGSHKSEADWRDELTSALFQAIDRRMIADVPVGVLLSGGVDSSLIVAMLAARGHSDIRTFSIGFENVRDVKGDEFRYSDLVAKRFNTKHYQIKVTADEALKALPQTIAAMSEPMMSHDAVGFFLLSREVSKHVKVAQSGQGADEVFAGYHWYQRLAHSNSLTDDYAKIYFDRDHTEMGETLHPSRMNGDYSREFIDRFFASCNGNGPVDQALQLDTQIMLVDDPVKRVDNMTMAWGLEARVPFLDHELVELAARMPTDLKLKGGGKYILKKVAEKFVPAEIINRPKGYFPVPALKYLQGGFLDFVRDVLHQPAAKQREVFNPDYIERLLKHPESNLTPKGHSKLWQVAVLEHWLQAHGI
jgi:asparagine synthase (glutamine-hydrolysing)